METWDRSDTIAVVAALVAVLAFLWAVYSHFATHRRAKVFYGVSQISEFDIPDPATFFQGIQFAPVAIDIQSAGNKAAESVELRVETNSDIRRYETVPSQKRDPVHRPPLLQTAAGHHGSPRGRARRRHQATSRWRFRPCGRRRRSSARPARRAKWRRSPVCPLRARYS